LAKEAENFLKQKVEVERFCAYIEGISPTGLTGQS
jgi:hypothetical protein